jgi:hypothetical protein
MLALRLRRVDGMVVCACPGRGPRAFVDGPPLVQLDRARCAARRGDAVMVHNAATVPGSARIDHRSGLGILASAW